MTAVFSNSGNVRNNQSRVTTAIYLEPNEEDQDLRKLKENIRQSYISEKKKKKITTYRVKQG